MRAAHPSLGSLVVLLSIRVSQLILLLQFLLYLKPFVIILPDYACIQ